MTFSKIDTEEIKSLKTDIKKLQNQLVNANKEIVKLSKDTSDAIESLRKKLYNQEQELITKITKEMEDIPDVLDSKPKKSKIKIKETGPRWA